jgi:hypothetical protein
MHETKIDDTPAGRVPGDDGWFILNLDEIGWRTIPGNGRVDGRSEAGLRGAPAVGAGALAVAAHSTGLRSTTGVPSIASSGATRNR